MIDTSIRKIVIIITMTKEVFLYYARNLNSDKIQGQAREGRILERGIYSNFGMSGFHSRALTWLPLGLKNEFHQKFNRRIFCKF